MSKHLPHTFQVPDRHGGLPRNYLRCPAGQKPISFGRGPQSRPEIIDRWHELMAEHWSAPRERKERVQRAYRAGTWNAMIDIYRRHSSYRDLDDKSSKKKKERMFAMIRETRENGGLEHGDILVRQTDVNALAEYIDALGQKFWSEAKEIRIVFSTLFNFAVAQKLVAVNPISQIKRPTTDNPDGHRDWSEDEITRYKRRHPEGSVARVALEIALETGMRLGDVVRAGQKMGVNQGIVGGDMLSFIADKIKYLGERARCNVPISSTLRQALAARRVPGVNQWLLSETGKPIPAKRLSKLFGEWIDEAGLPDHCVAHGLRKSFVRRMIDGGVEPHDVAAMTGHQDLELVMFYGRQRDKRIAGERGRKAMETYA
jgi:site-specific recombinase XerD